MYALLIILLGGFLSENVLEKIEEIRRKRRRREFIFSLQEK